MVKKGNRIGNLILCPLQTQFMTFFISPFSEPSSSAELNNFLKSHRIINVELAGLTTLVSVLSVSLLTALE